MSGDSVEENAAFARKYQLPFPLLSDTAGEVCQAYGACHDLSSGRITRNTYVIGTDKTILHVFEEVTPQDQAETVLAFLRKPSQLARQAASSTARAISQPNVNVATINTINTRIGEQGKMDEQNNESENGQAHQATITDQHEAAKNQPQGPMQTVTASQIQPAQDRGGLSLVYALGTLGYDLVTEARRDSISQHMGGTPHDHNQLLTFLAKNPWEAEKLIWTLNLDATPIYAILPRGAFASAGYERLQQFLYEQLTESVERISVPGILSGQVRLMSGQIVPVIWPDLRCMYSWTTAALIKSVCGEQPPKSAKDQEHQAYTQQVEAVTNFLERVYHELRNLGITPQERAINYTATNAMNVAKIFEAAIKDEMELDTIEVERSPICRLDSDCWDVKLTFFPPGKVFEQARKVYRFTVDVSDVCPVMIGKVRSWFVR